MGCFSLRNRLACRTWFVATAATMLVGIAGCRPSDAPGPVARSSSSETIREAFSSGSGEASSTGAVASTGTGWATLKGRFIFDGTPPTMAPYNANATLATCAPGGKAPLQETLVVDPQSGGIANVAIYLRKASRVHESAKPNNDTVVFDQKVCQFLTHVFPMTVGQTMEVKNSDDTGHNTNITGKSSANVTVPAGESVSHKPQKEESVPKLITCSMHPWMVAYYLPRKNGYVAVTAADGSFEIPNLPAGETLEIQVWHESATGPVGVLVLGTPEAKALKWSGKGRFKITLEPDEVKEIEFSVPAVALGG